jgi:hypothetical protein
MNVINAIQDSHLFKENIIAGKMLLLMMMILMALMVLMIFIMMIMIMFLAIMKDVDC